MKNMFERWKGCSGMFGHGPVDNWLSAISRFWSCPRLSKLVDSRKAHGVICTLHHCHHCQMWSSYISYTLHISTWRGGHGSRREMLALTRLAPCAKRHEGLEIGHFRGTSSYCMPRYAEAATTHEGHVRRVGSWICSTLLCFQLWLRGQSCVDGLFVACAATFLSGEHFKCRRTDHVAWQSHR